MVRHGTGITARVYCPRVGKPTSVHAWHAVNSLIRRAVLAGAFLLPAGCFHVNLPAEVQARDPGELPHMNHALLAASRICVRVDWTAGERPLPHSLDVLQAWLAREARLPLAAVDVHAGEEIPAVTATAAGLAEAARAHALPDGAGYFVWVLFSGAFERYRGITFPAGELDPAVDHPVVVMLVEAIRHDSWFPLSRAKIEPAVLVHEFGHVAGLVTSGRRVHDGHCPNPKCRMYHGPDWPAIWANAFPVLCLWKLPIEMCDDCERELAEGHDR